MTAIEALKYYYGYNSFRGEQQSLIDSILLGQDVLGIMPTGFGKSICFQIPAIIMRGITVVISPLISLMKDQVYALGQTGIKAAYINSSLGERQIQKVLENANNGSYKLIYIAPERLQNSNFLRFATTAPIDMVAVDEAHCISQWGQDFRPEYAQIPHFVDMLAKRPVVSAFTATATEVVKNDIINRLSLIEPSIVIGGFDRPNLYYDIIRAPRKRDKFGVLAEFLKNLEDATGIVYCSTRKNVEEVCENLKQIGYRASRYHGGLTESERAQNQDDFLLDKIQVMVATNAFGMGIDKSNVSYVVHYNMPKDLEGYYQEAGRAGRDGSPAKCFMIFSPQDIVTNKYLINSSTGDTATAIMRLQKMEQYCHTPYCLRNYILKYFGEKPQKDCGHCINCNTEHITENITIEAQKIISCVARMKERFGVNMVIDVLVGDKKTKDRLALFGLQNISTFGISTKSKSYLQDITNFLIQENILAKSQEKLPILMLGTRAKEILKKDAFLEMRMLKERTIPTKSRTRISQKTSKAQKAQKVQKEIIAPQQTEKTITLEQSKELLIKLKDLRLSISKQQKVPAFVIFHDSTLRDMCVKLPINEKDLLEISGMGKIKAQKYGAQFLEVIREFVE